MTSQPHLPGLTLVLGGAASGKSAFAEGLVAHWPLARTYLATAHPNDDEMQHKIARHVARRGRGWRTIDAPADADRHLAAGAEEVVFFDSVTLWVAANMDAGADALIDRLASGLAARRGPVVAVSDEVGQGIVPDNAPARAFRDTLGRVNQWLATRADLVVMVHAGLPLVLKGRLPGAAP